MHFLIKYRWFCLAVVLLSVAILFQKVEKAIQIDNRLSVWFLDGDSKLENYYDFQEMFGNDETLFIFIRQEGDILKQSFLDSLHKLTILLEDQLLVENVFSPTNFKIPDGSAFGVPRFSNLQNRRYTEKDREDILKSNPNLAQIFFGTENRGVALFIQPKADASYELERAAFVRNIKQACSSIFPSEKIQYAGVGIIYEALNRLSEKEFRLFLALTFILIFALILFIYRSITVLLFTLTVLVLANCLTLGLYGASGGQLNVMSSLIPILICLLGVMDVIHIVKHHSRGINQNDRGRFGMKSALIPCFLTTVTTMLGFLALRLSPMPILQDFGLFAAIGILFAFMITFLTAPIFLPHIRVRADHKWFRIFLPTSGYFTKTRRRRIIFFASLILIIVLFGTSKLKVNSNTLSYFPKNAQVRQDDKLIKEHYGAYLPLEYLITTTNENTSGLLEHTLQWACQVEAAENRIDNSFGFHSLMQVSLQNSYQDHWRRALKSTAIINKNQQYLKDYYPTLYNSFIHDQSNTVRITFYTNSVGANELTSIIENIDRLAHESFSKDENIFAAGYQPMYSDIIDSVIDTQISSLLAAFVMVFLVLLVLVRDLRFALLGSFINLLPVVFIFGLMGYSGINLDSATASIAAIVLCICIDDTIHFIHHYLIVRRKERKSVEQSVHETLQVVGGAIFVSSIVLFVGFSVMIFASLKTVFYFGLLISIAVLVALISLLILFPSLLFSFLSE